MKYLVTVSLLFFLTGNATGQEASGDSVQLPQLKEILLPILRGALSPMMTSASGTIILKGIPCV